MSALSLQHEFNELSNEQQIELGLEITRSLTLPNRNDGDEMIIIPDNLQSFYFFGMEISPFPTESRKIIKYIPTSTIENIIDPKNFVKVDKFSVVFVNIEDLSYHNFENILNLDYLFDDVSFSLIPNVYINKKVQIFDMNGSMDTLLSLDSLNYYTVPINNQQRGGKRMIFHSNQLSFALTKMIYASDFFDKKNFSHVNNVFRLNNFAPGDKKFKSHYDTPYADSQKDLYSKYTMIIYLTGNKSLTKHGSQTLPPLRIEDTKFDHIRANQCIIFNQDCEHEGNAYSDNDKIFIRTELIFRIKNFKYDKNIAEMFNIACYMTKEPSQQQYSADLFNNCVKMRYNKEKELIQRVYLIKSNFNTAYVTDGNYYWFPNKIGLKSIAMLIILDYFNGKHKNLKNIKIKSKVLPRKYDKDFQKEVEVTDEYIFSKISDADFSEVDVVEKKVKRFQDLAYFNPIDLCEDSTLFECDCDQLITTRYTARSYFDNHRKKAQDEVQKVLDRNTVLIFDNQITINYENIQIEMDKRQDKEAATSGLIQLSDFYIKSQNQINFASCTCYRFVDLVEFDKKAFLYQTKKIQTFCLPDIQFQEQQNGYKLSIDIFNNGFVYQSTSVFQQPYYIEELWKRNKYEQRHKTQFYINPYEHQSESQDYFENISQEEQDYINEQYEAYLDQDEEKTIETAPYKKKS